VLVFAFSAYDIAFALNNEESKQSVPSISEDISPNGETGALEEHYPIKGYSERRGERTDKWTEEQRGFYFETNRKCLIGWWQPQTAAEDFGIRTNLF
jgi:hypothetical protein